jgi:hypothetical protein
VLDLVCGWEAREAVGFNVAQFSAIRRTSEPLRFIPLMENALRYNELYTRPHEQRNGQLWDMISNAPMATSFACSRFLAPWLSEKQWVLGCDFADMLFCADPAELFNMADDRYAVMVVKHRHEPDEQTKMDGQIQTAYSRKNWSSVILWNTDHPGNTRLTLEMVNSVPGRELHQFCWLEDDEIGELPVEWNFLVDITPMTVKPKLLHFTRGIPAMAGYESGPWADMWLKELAILDATRSRLPVVRAA